MSLTRFYQLSFDWRPDGLVVRRDGQVMFEVSGWKLGVALRIESEERSKAEHLALLRLSAGRFEWLFFVDYDGVQTNMREVDPGLNSLSAVHDWLLTPGYMYRQGDVGVYRVDLPDVALRDIPSDLAEQRLMSVLKGRHVLEADDRCRYYEGDGVVFVQCFSAMRMVHPEHPALEIAAGTYRMVPAAGVVYPLRQNVRHFRGASLFC